MLFWEILKEKNPLLLDPEYHEERQYSDEEKEYVVTTWNTLYDEVFLQRNETRSKVFLRKKHKEAVYLARLEQIEGVLRSLATLDDNKHFIPNETYLELLNNYYGVLPKIDKRLACNPDKPLTENLNHVTAIYNALLDKYHTSIKTQEKEVQKEIKNVFEVVAKVEQVLERSLPIEEISVLRWLAYEKLADEKSKSLKNEQQRQQLHKRKRPSR